MQRSIKGIVKTAVSTMCLFCALCLEQSCVEQRPKILENTDFSIEPFRLEVSADQIHFDSPQSDSRILQVRASNVKWAFREIPDWITISPQSGSGDMEVSIQVSENTGAKSRVGLLSFGSDGSEWNYSVGITVSQYRAPYVITLPVDMVEMDAGGEIKTIQVFTNTDDWSIQVPSSMSQWCTARKTEDGIVLTVPANTSNESREGLIELRTDDVSAFLTVIQRPAGIMSTTDRLVFPMDGGVQSLPVNVEAAWSIETSYSWIDIKTCSGPAGFVIIPMEAVPNFSSKTRDGFIYIVLSDDRKIEIPVHQDCIEFSLDRDSIHFQSGGSIERLDLRSNVNWLIPDSIGRIDWISINPMAGNGNMHFLITADANLSIDSRSLSLPIYIVSKADGTTISSKTIEITQDGRLFGADSAFLYFSDKAGSTLLNIKSDGYWFLNPMESWIMIEPDEGDRDAQVKFSVAENLGREGRSGSVVLRTYGERDTISVYQSGKYIDVSSNALEFHSNTDSTEVILTTNGHWTAESIQSWIKLSESEGNGDCRIIISVADNPSISKREGEVTVTRVDMNPIRIKVIQKGRFLTVSTNRIEFFSIGGKSEPVIVQTDGEYDVQTESDWITVDRETESQFTISVTENKSSNSRNGVVNVSLTGLVKDTLIEISIMQRSVEDSYEPTGYEGTYGYVDLGLSVNWATYNVGATTPEEYGNYYAWGETEPKDKYTFDNYSLGIDVDWDVWFDWDQDWWGMTFNKYVTESECGIVDSKTILDLEDDVAHIKWGGAWRMPTYAECYELLMKCDWRRTTWIGVDGWIGTSMVPGYTDRYIFLPAAGAKGSIGPNEDKTADGDGAFYWSSSLSSSTFSMGIAASLDGDSIDLVNPVSFRLVGLPVRPVLPSGSFVVSSITLDKNSILLEVYESSALNVKTIDGNDDVEYYPVTWSTSDAEVINIDYSVSGNHSVGLNAISEGTAIVTATIGSVQSYCIVTVKPATIDSIDLSHKYVEIDVGDTLTIKPTFYNISNSIISTLEKNVYWHSSDSLIAKVDSTGLVTAVSSGECTITAAVGDIHSTCTVIVLASTVPQATPEYVDLGLSVNWATFNVGANAPEEYGDYFAWGETEPYYEEGYAHSSIAVWKEGKTSGYYWLSYKYSVNESDLLTKYCNNDEFGVNNFIDGKTILEMIDDVANVEWGDDWRIPTSIEYAELISNCNWVWTTRNGVEGYEITSNVSGYEDKSIFLPATGYNEALRAGTSLMGYGAGGYGCYWSSSLSNDDSRYASGFLINSSSYSICEYTRDHGYPVRPVCPSSTYVPPTETIDSIALSNKILNLKVGDTVTVFSTPFNDKGAVTTVAVQWFSSNTDVATVDDFGLVTAVGLGECTLTISVGDVQSTCSVAVMSTAVQQATPEYVDLGLSVKWATYNLGATAPEEFGDYFAWGETEPYYELEQIPSPLWKSGKDAGYDWLSYCYYNYYSGDTLVSKVTKYYWEYDNYTDTLTTLELSDDAAYVNWGGSWRMPTDAEFMELADNCNCSFVAVNGVWGMKLTSKKSGFEDRSIFLPSAGNYDGTVLNGNGIDGYYWSSSLDITNYESALPYSWHKQSDENWDLSSNSKYRYCGLSIRPVCP